MREHPNMTLYEKETAHLLCFHHWVRPVYHSTSRYNPLCWRVSARQSVWNRIMQGLSLLKRVMNCACIPFFFRRSRSRTRHCRSDNLLLVKEPDHELQKTWVPREKTMNCACIPDRVSSKQSSLSMLKSDRQHAKRALE